MSSTGICHTLISRSQMFARCSTGSGTRQKQDSARRSRSIRAAMGRIAGTGSCWLVSADRPKRSANRSARASWIRCALVVGTSAAWTQYMAGDYEASIETCRNVMDMKPDFTPAWRVLGAALIQMGRAAEGVAELEAAAATAPADPVLLAWLAHAKAVRGECGVATTILEALDRLRPTAFRSRVPPCARARGSLADRPGVRAARSGMRRARPGAHQPRRRPAVRSDPPRHAIRKAFRATAAVSTQRLRTRPHRPNARRRTYMAQRVVGLLIAVLLAMPVLARAQAAPAKHPDFTGSWKVTNIEMPAPPAGGARWGSWIWRSRRLRWTRRSRLRRRGASRQRQWWRSGERQRRS